jgi:hypothetical protein
MASVQIKDAAIPASIRESVERARAKAPPPPGPDPVTTYLACVYREVMSWLEGPGMLKVSIKKYYENTFHQRMKQNYFRILIELSARPHVSAQEKSKYVTVLRHAWNSEVPPDDFEKFLEENGGIKGTIEASKLVTKKRTAPRKRATK